MPEPQPAPAFGRYRDPVMLGAGGMGAVYRATDPSLDRYVAIKVLTHRDPRYVERFRREAQVLAKIGHPSIIQIYEIVGSDEDTADPYIVMEYFDGRSLDLLLKQGPLSPAQVVSIVRQCADGLRKAHANNVIHRDIKPGNVMMSPEGEVKILDFGIAKLRDAKKDLTGQVVLGTPYYMSPEQATGYAIDARSDIYSLGLTAFHLLTARKPFEAKSKVDVMLMQVKAPLPSLTELVPCDERIVRMVEKMCAKKPAERYQSCEELIAAIESLPRSMGGRQADAAPAELEKTRALPTPLKPPHTSAARVRGQGAPLRTQPTAGAPGRLWTGVVAGAAAAVLVLAALAFFYERSRAAARGRVPQAGWLSRSGLRKVQSKGGYGNCIFFPRELERGAEGPGSVYAELAADEPIHGRCYFPRPAGENKTGQIWEELWVDGRKRAHVIFDPPLPPDDDQLALQVSGRHAARLRELSSGKHTVEVWIYRQAGDADNPVPLAAGELVVRK
jgi:predicted Ser/Thr protein kinase